MTKSTKTNTNRPAAKSPSKTATKTAAAVKKTESRNSDLVREYYEAESWQFSACGD